LTNNPIIFTGEVAEILGVPEATLRVWRHHRKGPRYFKIGRKCAYRRDDVNAWIEEMYQTTGSAEHSA